MKLRAAWLLISLLVLVGAAGKFIAGDPAAGWKYAIGGSVLLAILVLSEVIEAKKRR